MSADATQAQKWLEALDDYASGHTADREAAALEEELFSRAAVGAGDDEAAFLDGLARIAEWMAEYQFAFRGGGTRAEVDALIASGRRVHYLELGAGGLIPPDSWPEGTQFVITRFGLDLRGYDDVEMEVSLEDGTVVKTFRSLACDPTDGALYAICHEPLARMASVPVRMLLKVSAVRDARRETMAVFETQQPSHP